MSLCRNFQVFANLYIVLPVSTFGGGGYVFAVKDDGEVKVLADGNGVIMCSFLEDYPDFSLC